MIPVGKLFIALIWTFWVLASGSVADGSPHDSTAVDEKKKQEYNPTYGITFKRVIERGHVICGTNDEFPGFSEEIFDDENGLEMRGFDVDICKAVAAAVFGDIEAIEFEIVNGRTRFEYLIDCTIDVLSAATTYTFTRNVLKRLEFLPTTYYDGQGFIAVSYTHLTLPTPPYV